MSTSNRFSSLHEKEKQDIISERKERQDPPTTKPPPIFVDKVSNIQPLITLLNEHVSENYEIKVLRNEQVKIQSKSSEAYSKIVKQVEIKQTEFYTYKQKKDRSFKVILKNMHPWIQTK